MFSLKSVSPHQSQVILQNDSAYLVMDTNTGSLSDFPVAEFIWRSDTIVTYTVATPIGTDVYNYDLLSGESTLLFSFETNIHHITWHDNYLRLNLDDGTIFLWDEQDGTFEQINTYLDHFSPDGQYVMGEMGQRDGMRIQSLQTGVDHGLNNQYVYSASWSPDSNRIAYTTENQLMIYNLSTEEEDIYDLPCSTYSYGCSGSLIFRDHEWASDRRWLVTFFLEDDLLVMIDTQTHTLSSISDLYRSYDNFLWIP